MVEQGYFSKRFFLFIPNQIIESGNLELPSSFVKKYGKHLSNYATLKVPTGEKSKMEIKRSKGKAWIHRGWAEFVVKYSIKCRYLLVFRYKGGSRFSVSIFGHTGLEIVYPPPSSSKTYKLIEVKEEESDVEILDEAPQKIQKVSGMENGSSARNRVMEKAKAFKSSNPHFSVMIRKTYKSCLYIPAEPGRSYFGGDKGNNRMRLIGDNGRSWSMNYIVGSPPRKQVRVSSGWSDFLKETRPQEGDVCVFELVNSRTMTFKITLKKAAEDLLLIASTVTNPQFTFRVTEYSLSDKPHVHIPVAHSREYLKEDDSITILDESNGKNWLVHLTSRSTSLSLSKGWKDFASANRLKKDDFLVFEMMNDKPKVYKVNIDRAASVKLIGSRTHDIGILTGLGENVRLVEPS